jgi:hypothetical protein
MAEREVLLAEQKKAGMKRVVPPEDPQTGAR